MRLFDDPTEPGSRPPLDPPPAAASTEASDGARAWYVEPAPRG